LILKKIFKFSEKGIMDFSEMNPSGFMILINHIIKGMQMANLKVLRKKILLILSALSVVFLITGSAFAGDDNPSVDGEPLTINAMPVLGLGEYGTKADNENNANTGMADGDMNFLISNNDPAHPIEFNINVPVANAPIRSGTLRMDVYDVDTDNAGDPEIDNVYVNGIYAGTLNGSNNTWGVNIFDIPIGGLKQGKNLVQIYVDQGNPMRPHYSVQVNWGIIKLAPATGIQFSKAWFTPIAVTRENYINAFAEISDPSNKVTKVEVYDGTTYLFDLTDPDGDSTWSGQYQIPAGWTAGYKGSLRIVAKNASGTVVARWPGITVK